MRSYTNEKFKKPTWKIHSAIDVWLFFYWLHCINYFLDLWASAENQYIYILLLREKPRAMQARHMCFFPKIDMRAEKIYEMVCGAAVFWCGEMGVCVLVSYWKDFNVSISNFMSHPFSILSSLRRRRRSVPHQAVVYFLLEIYGNSFFFLHK